MTKLGENEVWIVDALFHEMAERRGGLSLEDWVNGSWDLFERGCLRLVDDGKHMGIEALRRKSCRAAHGLYSDAAMGRRVNVSGRTIRRHRKALADQGLIEVLGYGKDHKPCMVRPILRDGSPVFLGPELAGRSDTNGRLTRPVVAAELLLTERPEGLPPLPPAAPADPQEGGEAFDREEDQPAAEPVQASEPREAPTQPPGTESAPAASAEALVPLMTFLRTAR
jgi:hypothetical protein